MVIQGSKSKYKMEVATTSALPSLLALDANKKSYGQVPPPTYQNDRKRKYVFGPKHAKYPPLPKTSTNFFILNAANELKLPSLNINISPQTDMSKYCPYHRGPDHTIK